MPEPPDATIPLSSAAEVRFKRIVVQVEDGDDMGKWAASGGEELAIGSAAGNDLVLTDATVSRHHCTITARPDGFVLRDMGSMNGTFLGGFRIETAYLKHGASLRVGRTKLRFQQLEEEIREPLSEGHRFGSMLGKCASMRRIFALLPKLAASDSTLLIEGETGTGKGLLARAIHEAGPRALRPMVVIDCASIPATLVESELFGHMRGSFTGAHVDRPGAFEAASGGTVFLDEIGELPLEMQPKLLRALEDRRVKRIGGQEPVALDVRVIAATNRDLRAEVNRGGFRADLYYRLHIAHVRIPPLRERREDIELYVEHFFEQLSPDDPVPPRDLVASLARQDFPGNVRELRALIERTTLLGEGVWPAAPDDDAATLAAPAFDPACSFRAAKERATAAWERAYLRELLESCQGNISKAARLARMDRNHLRELLRRRGLGGA